MSQARHIRPVRRRIAHSQCVLSLLIVIVSSTGTQEILGGVLAFSTAFTCGWDARGPKSREFVGRLHSEQSDCNYRYGQEINSTGCLEYQDTLMEKEMAVNLLLQAKMLRDDAQRLREQLEKEKAEKMAKRTAKIDSWIEKLLIETQVDDRTQLLKSEQQVLLRLQEDRFSQEQINAIFNRICELGPQSRSSCSPLMELLVDSVGKMDELERQENPNKRWSGKVERVLRRRLFAMDWNMDIEDSDHDDLNPWKLR